MSGKILTLENYHGETTLYPIGMDRINPEDREYHVSRLEDFYYVFHKDNLPTYHQQVNNFLHWKWNEYHNDPNRYESMEYKTKILNKIFNFVNGRIYGILNPINNHADIIFILEKAMSDHYHKHISIMPYIKEKIVHLRGRHSEFTRDDAIVWYHLADSPVQVYGYTPKPMVIPYLIIDGTKISLLPYIRDFYLAIFQYAIRYYDYMYEVKWTTTWELVDPSKYIFLSHDTPDSILSYTTLTQISSLSTDNLIQCFIYSEDGNYHDTNMNPYTQGVIAYHNGEYYISAQRGFNLFTMDNDTLSGTFVDSICPKHRNEESIRTEMWQDVMQSNAVLFPIDSEATFQLRILHYNKYSSAICVMFNSRDRILHVDNIDSDDSIGYLSVHIDTLWKIFQYMEHTLDLWIYWGVFEDWSLISNMYHNKSSLYIEKPYLQHVESSGVNLVEDNDVFAIIPREGISWTLHGIVFHHDADDINGISVRKTYL